MLTTLLEPYDDDSLVDATGAAIKAQSVAFYVGEDVGEIFLTLPIDWQNKNPDNHSVLAAYNSVNAILPPNGEMNTNSITVILDDFINTNRQLNTLYGVREKALKGEVKAMHQYRTLTIEIMRSLERHCSVLFYSSIHQKGFPDIWPRIFNFTELFRCEESRTSSSEIAEISDAIFKEKMLEKSFIYEISAINAYLTSPFTYITPFAVGAGYPTVVLITPPINDGYKLLLRNHAMGQLIAGMNKTLRSFGLFM